MNLEEEAKARQRVFSAIGTDDLQDVTIALDAYKLAIEAAMPCEWKALENERTGLTLLKGHCGAYPEMACRSCAARREYAARSASRA